MMGSARERCLSDINVKIGVRGSNGVVVWYESSGSMLTSARQGSSTARRNGLDLSEKYGIKNGLKRANLSWRDRSGKKRVADFFRSLFGRVAKLLLIIFCWYDLMSGCV